MAVEVLSGGGSFTRGNINAINTNFAAASTIDEFVVSGDALHATNLTAWTAPSAAVILRVWLNITTPSTGASTIDCGYTATTATTSSDTLLDGVSGASAALFDSMNAALDTGTNAKAQLAASGKWITLDEASGDTSGMVATLYIEYRPL